DRAGRILLDEDLPRIAHGLLEAERDAALDRIDLEDLHLDLLGGRHDLARVHVLLGPRHLGDVDQALDARLELDDRAVVGDVGHAALEAGADRELGLDALPRIIEQLLHAERDAMGLVVDLDDLDLHLLADVEHLGRVIDAPPGDVGDVQQAIDAAEIHERTVIGDVLHDAVDDLALFEVLHQLLALFGACLFQHGAAGHDDVATPAIHLQDLELLLHIHERSDVADRANVDLRSRQEGYGAVEIDGEAALDLIEDDSVHLLVAVECLLQLAPALFSPPLVPRQHVLAQRILDPLEIDFDIIADLQVGLPSGAGEFTQGHAAFGLQADVDDGEFLFYADDLALDDGTFLQISAAEGFIEQLGEVFTRGCCSGGHGVSCMRRAGGVEWRSKGAGRRSRRPTAASRIRSAGAKTVLSERWFEQARLTQRLERGFVLQTRGAVSRALGPLGWPRRCRWRPGWPRLYPNAWYRASARRRPVLAAPPCDFDHARR